MASVFTQDMSVQDVMRNNPGGAVVLRRFGIAVDSACSLAEVAADKGLPIELLLIALDRVAAMTAAAGEVGEGQLQRELLVVITEYIEDRFHIFLRSELSRLEKLLGEVREAHSRTHGEMLGALRMVFMSFKAQIEEHLKSEEQILFPYLRNIERCAQSPEQSTKAHRRSSPVTAIDELKEEHKLLDGAFKDMRALTSDYTCSKEEPEAFAILYEGLAGLEADHEEHVRLENGFLWPVWLDQATADAALPAEEALSPILDDGFACPRTDQPCESGSAALCNKFWDCVRDAMQQRWEKVESQISDLPNI